VSGAVAPDPRHIQWAQTLCVTLDPVFTAVEPPPGAADLEAYRERLAAARAAVDATTPALTDVGPAPSDEGQTIIERVDERLERLAADLAAAAALLDAVDGADPATTERALSAARAALGSFDRAGLAPLLQPDPAVRNALPYAPACVGSA
jgi:hypothetical protein